MVALVVIPNAENIASTFSGFLAAQVPQLINCHTSIFPDSTEVFGN
jgi:hypothetical protein